MPRQSDPSRKPRTHRTVSQRERRATNGETQRALLQQVGTDEERLSKALSKVDAPTGAAVVSHLGHQVGNTALHRVLLQAAAVMEADAAITISFGSGANSSLLTAEMREILEAILRAAGLRSALVVRTGRKQGCAFFDVAPGSIANPAAFEQAAEARAGESIVRFLFPPHYRTYHFEVTT